MGAGGYLARRGLVPLEPVPLRRVCALTDAGRAAFRAALDAWMEETAALQDSGRAFAAKGGCA